MPATAVSANVNTTDIFVSNSTNFAFGVDGSGNANSHIVFNGTNLVIDSDSDAGSGGAIILDSGGNGVGIGTTSPAEALDVVGNAKVSGNLTASGDLSLTGSNSSESVIAQEWDGTGNNSRIILKNNDVSGTLQEVLRVDAVGKVGIGTASPAYDLQVDGSAGFGDTSVASMQILTTSVTLDGTDSTTPVDIPISIQRSSGMCMLGIAGNSNRAVFMYAKEGDFATGVVGDLVQDDAGNLTVACGATNLTVATTSSGREGETVNVVILRGLTA